MTAPEQLTDGNANRATRRRLTPDQQREVARLYSETSASAAEIRGQFGIGESSLYRVLQKQGVSLRGRASRPANGEATLAPTTSPGTGAQGTRRGGGVGSSRRRVTSTPATAGDAGRQFRVYIRGQRIFEAQDVRDALRQAEALGAIEVVDVTLLN